MSDTATRIINATNAILGREERLTMEAVAAEAGISRQTLYQYYGNRAELLVAAVEQHKADVDFDALVGPVLTASTATEALSAMVDLHIAFTPSLLPVARAIAAEVGRDPTVRDAFDDRPIGRHQLALLVTTRLAAEGLLAPGWSAESAADLMAAMTSPITTEELLRQRQWSLDELKHRTLLALRNAVIDARALTKEPTQ